MTAATCASLHSSSVAFFESGYTSVVVVLRPRQARAEHEPIERVLDHALLRDRLADDSPVRVRRAMCVTSRTASITAFWNSARGSPRRRRSRAVGDDVRLARLPVPRRLRRAELGLVRVRGLVQVEVREPGGALGSDERCQKRGFDGGGRVDLVEASVRIHRLRVPALDALVPPRRDARRDENVERVWTFAHSVSRKRRAPWTPLVSCRARLR